MTGTSPADPFGAAAAAPSRVIIEAVEPAVDGGRFPIKRTVGETVTVTATIITDGHDRLAAVCRTRRVDEPTWHEQAMAAAPNDLWHAELAITDLCDYEYAVEAWLDRFATWHAGLMKKLAAGQPVASELLAGAALVRDAAARAADPDATWLADAAARLAGGDAAALATATDPALAELMGRHPDRAAAERSAVRRVAVDRARARSGAWYEFFPRSAAAEPGRHGTLADAAARLPYVAAMGFDVVYLPPIHPIGRTHRKGPNNTPAAGPDDPGSPWAIGAAEGGHDAVHPALGTLDDVDRLVARARELGMEIALDLAFQCSPDHPYVHAHPEWFYRRPDGSIQYAENPPKQYQDIYPLNFECDDWRALWAELERVVLFWIARGIRIFRVDNPHTKPLRFWEWLIARVRARHADVIFLAEAFTRPAVMRALATRGFNQSYTYFTWRNTKAELVAYFTELTQPPVGEYMRPNLFANTPDILHEFLQFGGRPAFQIRLLLAATLGATYGIYGPPFELCVGAAVPGTEEYLDSEKYQVRHWTLDAPDSLRELITVLNGIRRDHVALQHDRGLTFVPVDNEALIAYVKRSPDGEEVILTVVSLDPHHVQSGWVDVPLADFGLDAAQPYQAHELVSGARYLWHGARNFVRLDPHAIPGQIFRIRRRIRTERDFDYFF